MPLSTVRRGRLIRALGFQLIYGIDMSDITFDDLIGKVILIGVTYVDKQDILLSRKQWWG
jgi:hypothetical protein